jgi:hypothetical protein
VIARSEESASDGSVLSSHERFSEELSRVAKLGMYMYRNSLSTSGSTIQDRQAQFNSIFSEFLSQAVKSRSQMSGKIFEGLGSQLGTSAPESTSSSQSEMGGQVGGQDLDGEFHQRHWTTHGNAALKFSIEAQKYPRNWKESRGTSPRHNCKI